MVRSEILSVAAGVFALAGCSNGGDSSASCVFQAEYAGRTYDDAGDVAFKVAGKLGKATLPACDDSPNDEPDQPEQTTAYRVEGVDPEVAIAVGSAPEDARLVAVWEDGELPAEVERLAGG